MLKNERFYYAQNVMYPTKDTCILQTETLVAERFSEFLL